MSNSIKHVSDDLRLALRAQADDDFDPELLYPGTEEEEEEEEEDDPDEEPEDDEGEEDRGDDVDPSLTEEDEPDPDADGKPVEEETDLELLAELAGEGGKAKMVPHARFNEVNETLKQERAERLRLEEELARAKGQQPAATTAAATPESKPQGFDFDAAEDRFMDALLDGDKEAAAKIRAEIRAEERKEFAQQSAQSAQQVTDAELKRREAEAEQQVAQKVMSAAITKYPFLNHESEDADAEAIEDVIARRDLYLKQGMPFAKALATAVEKVAPRYAPQEEEPKPTKRTATAEQINRNLDREKRIPAAMPGVGERGKDIDYAKLSEDEFDALSEADKRKARGDFVKEDA